MDAVFGIKLPPCSMWAWRVFRESEGRSETRKGNAFRMRQNVL